MTRDATRSARATHRPVGDGRLFEHVLPACVQNRVGRADERIPDGKPVPTVAFVPVEQQIHGHAADDTPASSRNSRFGRKPGMRMRCRPTSPTMRFPSASNGCGQPSRATRILFARLTSRASIMRRAVRARPAPSRSRRPPGRARPRCRGRAAACSGGCRPCPARSRDP